VRFRIHHLLSSPVWGCAYIYIHKYIHQHTYRYIHTYIHQPCAPANIQENHNSTCERRRSGGASKTHAHAHATAAQLWQSRQRRRRRRGTCQGPGRGLPRHTHKHTYTHTHTHTRGGGGPAAWHRPGRGLPRPAVVGTDFQRVRVVPTDHWIRRRHPAGTHQRTAATRKRVSNKAAVLTYRLVPRTSQSVCENFAKG